MIFLKGNVPSLKNSKIKTSRGIFPSKTVIKYLRYLGIKSYSSSKKRVEEYVKRENMFKETLKVLFQGENKYPLIVGFHFVRDSKRKFDFNNATQIIADLLTAHDFIEDDDMDHFLPIPMELGGQVYSIDKDNPGVYIKIINKINID